MIPLIFSGSTPISPVYLFALLLGAVIDKLLFLFLMDLKVLLASCFVPLYAGVKAVEYQGEVMNPFQ